MKTNQITLLVLLLTLLSCNNEAKMESSKKCCSKENELPASAKNTDESIFNISSTWKTQNEDAFTFSNLSNKITVAAMVFTSCKSACPRIVADIQRIESALSPDELKQVSFLLISMDPENDTPKRCKEFAAEYQLNNNWALISASEDATMEIANVLDVRIKKLSGGGFDHSNTIFVINQNGIIAHEQNGLAVEPAESIQAIKTLLKK